MLQESRLPRWTFYRYSRSISQRSSLSWITTRNRMVRTEVQRVGWTCERGPYILTHSRGKEKIQRTLVSYFEQNTQKWTYEASIWLQSRCHNEKSLTPRIRRTNWRAHPSRSAKTHTTRTRDFLRILLVQRSNWSTYRMAILAFNFKFLVLARIRMELEVSSHKFFFARISFFYSWFRLQLIAIHCNRRGVWTEHFHTRIFSHICTLILCAHAFAWLKVLQHVSL